MYVLGKLHMCSAPSVRSFFLCCFWIISTPPWHPKCSAVLPFSSVSFQLSEIQFRSALSSLLVQVSWVQFRSALSSVSMLTSVKHSSCSVKYRSDELWGQSQFSEVQLSFELSVSSVQFGDILFRSSLSSLLVHFSTVQFRSSLSSVLVQLSETRFKSALSWV